jgi:RecB family exonuclease
VITPRRTRLVRVSDLHAFRRAIIDLCGSDEGGTASRLVIVPTAGAARQLRRTMGSPGEFVTRDELYDRLCGRLGAPPRRLTASERDVMIRASARAASAGPHPLRPGLVAEMLRFYDQLRRQGRAVGRFEELLEETFHSEADLDRGAARMLAQTRLLVAAFRGYEQRVGASGACDEHTLRDRLLAEPAARPVRHVIVTVGDWIADPQGLYLADFDLLTRLPGLEAIDLVATERLLASGFHERIHQWLPGIEEVAATDGREAGRPVLLVPAGDSAGHVFTHRDREDELIAVARRIASTAPGALDRVAVVYKQPLPYLYLAPAVFGGARIPFQTADGFPIAAEPVAAALDLVFEFVESGFTRRSLVALLRSPHFVFSNHPGDPACLPFEPNDGAVWREAVAALDRGLSERRYLGGLDRLVALEDTWLVDAAARPALAAGCAAAQRLAALAVPGPASAGLRCLLSFIDEYGEPGGAATAGSREERARAAVRGVLEALLAAHEAHDDPVVAFADLAASIRRVLEEQTFVPDTGETGMQLLDDQSARYGGLDEIAVVGLIDGEWPEKPRRNIFYSSSLLASLGWPSERDRRAAAEARFVDLLGSASSRVAVSTVTLEDDAPVEASMFVDAVPRAGLLTRALDSAPPASPMFAEEMLLLDPSGSMPADAFDPEARAWLALRTARTPPEAPVFHGQAGPLDPSSLPSRSGPARSAPGRPRAGWSISALETYLGCPFRFFARYVLGLDEEPEDEEVMNPRARGEFVHRVFEAFFTGWQAEGHGAITPGNLDRARHLFADIVDQQLAALPDAEAALERTRLLGGPVGAGLGEAVLRMEAERPAPVVGRLLEHQVDGEFELRTDEGPRRLALRAKVDRVDLLEDGTFRLIDYKLGWPPNPSSAIQLPAYGLCLEQRLDGYLGRRWILGEAAYLAFKGPRRVVPLFTTPADRAQVLAEAQARLVATVDAIARGDFPPRPDDVFRCETCSYAAVCRKDYVGDV